uniref:AAA+ ATPase domain-containing protein n=1 Tax=viral metagenome TaxID=1070528 RepID=A0A6C0JES6_9ZZZZ
MKDLQWVDKYKPKSINDVFGNKKNIELIQKWIKVFNNNSLADVLFKNAILISGPPGIGKTSIAHILLNEYNYDTLEFNASELRTSKIISEKLENILSGNSIKMMFNKDIKTGIILDEIDGIESRKEYSSSDIIDYINFGQKKTNKKNKKSKKVIINKNPIICICNNVNKSINPLLPYVIHINFEKPTDNDIFSLLSKINKEEDIGLSDIILNIMIPYCQSDFRRSIYLLEHLHSFNKEEKLNTNKVLSLLKEVGFKDIDLGLFEAVNNVFLNYDQNIEQVLSNFYADQNFVPFLVHENFIEFIDRNTNNTYEEKLDLCLDYYENLTNSQVIKNNLFGNWNLIEHVGISSCVIPNSILKRAKLKDTLVMKNFEKSALISKYNYRYYNLKSINHICKKMDIDIKNFQILAIFVVYYIFVDKTYLEHLIKYFKKFNIIFKEFEKIMKLSSIFEEYAKKYTKKMQKELNIIFDKF